MFTNPALVAKGVTVISRCSPVLDPKENHKIR